MKYSELGFKLNPEIERKSIWRYRSKDDSPIPRYGEILQMEASLKKIKLNLFKSICSNVRLALKSAESEREVGLKLDPLFQSWAKGYLLADHVDPDLLLRKANKNTLDKKLQNWAHQLNQNIPQIKSHPGIKIYFDQFVDIPCVIVCAGPSLKNAVEKLKEIKGRALIMALDTSFRSCTKRAIDPDFVNTHDANGPDPKTGMGGGPKFFQGIPTKSVGVFVNYVHPLTIQAFQGPITFYYVDDDSISVYKTMAHACDGPERYDGTFLDSKITGGSSVAHTALYIAIRMGCNPITFVGLDLSYPDLTKSHFESDNMKNPTRNKLIDVEAINGKKVKTDLSFFSYKNVFDRMAPIVSTYENVDLFQSSQNDDGSPAGIIHAGLEPMPFDEWIKKYATEERKELKQILEVYESYGYKLQE